MIIFFSFLQRSKKFQTVWVFNKNRLNIGNFCVFNFEKKLLYDHMCYVHCVVKFIDQSSTTADTLLTTWKRTGELFVFFLLTRGPFRRGRGLMDIQSRLISVNCVAKGCIVSSGDSERMDRSEDTAKREDARITCVKMARSHGNREKLA